MIDADEVHHLSDECIENVLAEQKIRGLIISSMLYSVAMALEDNQSLVQLCHSQRLRSQLNGSLLAILVG